VACESLSDIQKSEMGWTMRLDTTKYEELMHQVESVCRRLITLEERAGTPSDQDAEGLKAREVLTTALAELHVAYEELRHQNDEMLATRCMVEAARQRYQELFDFGPDGYLVTDTDGKIQEANRAAAAMLTVDQDILEGKPLLLFVAEGDRMRFSSRLAEIRVSAGNVEALEMGLQPRHGASFPAAVTIARTCDTAGRFTGLRWSFRDITQIKRAEDILRRTNAELDQRVQERTADLTKTHEALRPEVVEHRHTEAALRESEERYRGLVEMAPETIGVHREGRWVYLNPSGLRLLGAADASEVVGRPVMDFIHPDDRRAIRERIRQVEEENKPTPLQEFRMVRADGQFVEVELTGISTLFQGQPATLVVIKDITERKRAEETIARLASFPELNPNPIIEVDGAGHVHYANPAALRLVPELRDVGLEHSWLAGLPSLFPTLQRGGQDPIAREVKVGNNWYEQRLHYVQANQRLRIYMFDITERKRAEEELQKAYERLSAVLSSITDAYFSLDPEWRFLEINSVAEERVFRRPARELVGKVYWEEYPEELDTDFYRLYQVAFAEGRPVHFEARSRIVPGGWFETHSYPRKGRLEIYLRDITQRKRAEEERERLLRQLEAEKARWETTVESMLDPVTVCDAEGHAIYMNAAYSRLISRQIQAGLDLNDHAAHYQLHHPDGSLFDSRDLPLQRAALHGEEVRNVEIVQATGMGANVIAIWNAAPLRDLEDRVTGAVAVGHDITELRRIEEALRRYQLLAERARDIVLVIGRDGRILEANQAATAAYRYSREELLALTIQEVRAPGTRALTAQQMAQAEAEGILFETVHCRKDGSRFPVEVSSCGTTLGREHVLLSIIRDITERKRAEMALREGAERLRLTLRAANAGSWEWDLRSREAIWSDEFFSLLGLVPGAVEPSHEAWLQSVHSEDREMIDRLVRRAIDRKEDVDIEFRIIRPDGNVRWLNSRGHSLYDEAGRPIRMLGITIDVTERKHAEESLRSACELLEGQLVKRTVELTGASQRLQVELTRSERTDEEIRRLGEALERRASELVALDKAGRALTTSLEPEAVLRLLMSEVRNLLSTEGVEVLLHDLGKDELVVVAAEGAGLDRLIGQRMPATAGVAGWVFRERHALLVNDVQGDPRYSDRLYEQAEITLRSLLGVPLIFKGALIGVLATINKVGSGYSREDLQIMVAISNAAAIAIENARLYATEQRRRRQLEAVRAVSAEITRELDLSKVLQLITRHTEALIGSSSGTVWLWDEAEQVLSPQTWLSRGEWIRGRRLCLGEGVAGIVAQRREGLIVNEYQRWPQALPFVLERGRITAVMAEPLLYHEQLLGVLAVDNEGTDRAFTAEDGDLLALFASHAAIAIQNAQLFEQVQAARERLENLSRRLVEVQEAERRHIARELHDEIGQALTGLKLILGMGASLAADSAEGHHDDAQALIGDLLTRVREMSLDLRPTMLDDLGLLPTMLWHFERYTARTHVQVVFKHIGVKGRRFPSTVETAVYRIVQEALTNVARHSGVREVAVRLWANEGSVGAQVEDRGRGFQPGAAFSAHATGGLSGMRERAELLGGCLAVESTPGAGTLVAVEFPLEDRGAR
jgi:PAS domain S-box-containing protein